MLALTADAYGLDASDDDSTETDEEGMAIPGVMTILGLLFVICLLMLAGMPPLAGFIGKLGMLGGAMAAPGLPQVLVWAFVALVIVSGLASLLALVRIGIHTFWAADGTPPRVLAAELAPIGVLAGLVILMTIQGQDLFRYMEATSRALHAPEIYVQGVMEAPRVVDGAEKP